MNPQARRAFALLAATNRISPSGNLDDILRLAKTYEEFIAQADALKTTLDTPTVSR